MRVSRHNAVNEVQMQRESNPYGWRDTPIYHHASTYEKAPTEICECFYRLIGFRELFLYFFVFFFNTKEFSCTWCMYPNSDQHNWHEYYKHTYHRIHFFLLSSSLIIHHSPQIKNTIHITEAVNETNILSLLSENINDINTVVAIYFDISKKYLPSSLSISSIQM